MPFIKTRCAHFHVVFIGILVLLCGALQAEITVPSILGSHMVIQQNQPIVLWGWASPQETVNVKFKGQTASAEADEDGSWRIALDPEKADSNPASLTISGSRSASITLVDVLIGEVWLCSGQSNMEWTMNRTHTPLPEINRADHPGIRLFKVPRKAISEPQADTMADWDVCSPDTVRDFSAVGYYFGLELHRKLGFPSASSTRPGEGRGSSPGHHPRDSMQ